MAANRRAATDDSLALVVVHNYRHALELELKAVVRALVAGEHARNPDGVDQQVAQVADRLERTHSLQALVDGLRELACRVGWTLAPIVADVCGQLHQRDPVGDYFRYPDVRRGGESKPARLAPLYLDVPGFARRADEAFVVLLGLLEQAQQDLHEVLAVPPAAVT